jgi:hypothetical protein
MRRFIATAVLLGIASSVSAQQNDPPRSDRRAPLAAVDSLEPAVDVSAPRVALIQPRQPAAAPAAPTPANPVLPAPMPVAEVAPTPPAGATAPRTTAGQAMDALDLGTTSITGNAELPKVLYIVPWKRSDLGDLVGRPVNTLLDEVLAPVDPEVFERHLNYYETLHGASQ